MIIMDYGVLIWGEWEFVCDLVCVCILKIKMWNLAACGVQDNHEDNLRGCWSRLLSILFFGCFLQLYIPQAPIQLAYWRGEDLSAKRS